MATAAQCKFAREVYEAAKKGTDIAPEFVTAQAILESAWGRSKIGKYNLFGITRGSNWTGETVLIRTYEYFDTPDRQFTYPEKVVAIAYSKTKKMWYYTVDRLFRDYGSLADCLADHTRILQKPGYADAWPYRHDAEEFARRISDCTGCKYATDPLYIHSITKLIRQVRRIVESSKQAKT